MYFRYFIVITLLLSSGLKLSAQSSAPKIESGTAAPQNTEAGICNEDTPFCKNAQTFSQQVCENNFVLLGCDKFLERNPKAKDKLNYCPSTKPTMAKKLTDRIAGCSLGFLGAGADLAMLVPRLINEILLKDHQLSAAELEQLDYFREHNTSSGKAQMLGPFIDLFKDPNGKTYSAVYGVSPQKPGVDCRDIVNQNYCYGYSAAQLYKQLIEKLSPMINDKTMSDQWVPPWSNGETRTLPHMQSIETLFNDTFGTRYQCYDDEHAANLTCYVLSTALIPYGAFKTYSKIMEYAGIVEAKNSEIALKLRAAKDVDPESLPKGLDIRPHADGLPGELSVERKQLKKVYKPNGKDPEFEWPDGVVHDKEKYLEKTAKMTDKDNQIAFNLENRIKRELNNTLKDLDLVDALDNHLKSIFIKSLKLVTEKYPDIQVTAFSDYKGLKLFFETKSGKKIPKSLQDDLDQLYKDAVEKNAKYLKESKVIVYDGDDPTLWYRSGMGANAQRASTAAKFSKIYNSDVHSAVYETPLIEGHYRNAIETTYLVKKEVKTAYPELFENENGLTIAKTSAIQAIKSSSSLSDAQYVLSERFNITNLSIHDVEKFKDYLERMNQFPPSVQAISKAKPTLADSANGGYVADIPCQSCENIRAAERAMESVRNSMKDPTKVKADDYMLEIGRQDQIATAVFEGRKAEFGAAGQSTIKNAAPIRDSGDELAQPVTSPQSKVDNKIYFDKVAKTVKGNGLRVAYVVPPAGPDGAKLVDSIAKQVLEREKVLRREVEGPLTSKDLDRIMFSSVVDKDGRLFFDYHFRDDTMKLSAEQQSYLQTYMNKVANETRFDYSH